MSHSGKRDLYKETKNLVYLQPLYYSSYTGLLEKYEA